MTSAPPRIAVVGAGAAGLAAAYHLQQAGGAVTVLEERERVGGRMHTDVVDGFRIDSAAQLFGSTYVELFRLLRALGAQELAIRTPGRDALWRKGRAHEVVYGSTAHLLASGAVPLTLKLRMGARYLPFLNEHADRLHVSSLHRAAPLDHDSIAAWGERELGSDFISYLVYPLLAAGYGGTPEETGAAVYHMMAHQGMGAEVFALRGGTAALCEVIAARLRAAGAEVRTATPVRAVEPNGSGVELTGDDWREHFDGALVATPASAARLLLEETGAAALLADVRYRPHVALALLLERPVGVRYFGLSFPRGETEVVAVACVQENKDRTLVPPGKGMLVAYATPRAAERLIERDASAVADAMLPELRRPFPQLESAILRARLYRWREGVTLFYPGYLEKLARHHQAASTAEPPLVLAGDYLCAPTAEGALISARRAADELLRRLRAVDYPAAR